jgi:diguanylate cyclase (GGDEF)-like protein
VLLREVDEIAARNFAERVRLAVADAEIPYGKSLMRLTVSVGMAIAQTSDRDIDDTIERADRGLYMAKNTGRNRVFYMPDPGALPSRHAA